MIKFIEIAKIIHLFMNSAVTDSKFAEIALLYNEFKISTCRAHASSST